MQTQLADEQLLQLHPLLKKLKSAHSIEGKTGILNELSIVHHLYPKYEPFIISLETQESGMYELAIKSIIAIGQAENVLAFSGDIVQWEEPFKKMLDVLIEIENFYTDLGGLVGYHIKILELMDEKRRSICTKHQEFTKPRGLDLAEKSEECALAVLNGLKNFPAMGMMYPIGGAGDRLGLIDEKTKQALPAGLLLFCGFTLIEALIRDLQAQEYLYYKVFKRQLETPVALMSSREKNNHEHVLNVFEQNKWFGRASNSFFFFDQPLVPLVTPEGHWVMKGLFELALKPGGHGVIWKLAKDRGVFEWFDAQNRKQVLIRQINNPMAGIDSGILAFIGTGCTDNKSFGFLSCPRQVKSAEGVLVTIESKTEKGFEYCISNLEYTSFALYGIEDVPEKEGGYSLYPSNTNILFADLHEINQVLKDCSIPGMLVNVKTGVDAKLPNGEIHEVKAGRLESTMQNISDCLVTSSESPLSAAEREEKLKTFVVYNERIKTISVTKNSYVPGRPVQETPEGAYYDYLLNARDLLQNHCQIAVPSLGTSEDYLARGPDFIFIYHPALGPLYQVISQKIRGGKLHKGSELQLDIVEVDIENLDLNGSLLINAEAALGCKDHSGILQYSNLNGKCTLKNVKVENKGREKRPDQIFWKNQLLRHEALKITLHGNAEFYAENVTISGDQEIEVQENYRMRAYDENGKVLYSLQKIDGPTWEWEYSVKDDNFIHLKKLEH